ncbi:hypothetical protein Nepgr_000466 [Nepenthes gracilis]|uniref:PROP1-like PPR domain-containing protein n=1 Tax=Nepenthes gracilis TaxID=150966 RepID=A0AAD3P6Q7_NEPGR|nr:hypothetical protein Nepgr_000466 [Nepenthes gracilis]
MLAISKTFGKSKPKSLSSLLIRPFNRMLVFTVESGFQSCRLISNSRSGFCEKLSGFVPISSFSGVHRYYQIRVEISWIWPFFAIVSKSIGSFKSIATQSSCDEVEVTDEFLNQILTAIKSSTYSDKEICDNIDKLCRAGSVSSIAKLLQLSHDEHIFLSDKAYNILLVAASEKNDIELSLQIFKYILVSSESLGSQSYLNLAKAFANTSDCIPLLTFVSEVPELAFPRRAVVMNRILYAFAECGLTNKALMIYNHMKSLKFKLDLFTYNTILGILGRAGHMDDMLREFTSMKEAKISPDLISYNTLISNLRKLGRLDLCLVYMREMRGCGFQPDLRTYTALIESFGRSGNIEESLRLLDEMKQRHIQPSIYVYRSLINNSKKIGKLEIAASLMEEMTSSISDLVGPKDFKRKTDSKSGRQPSG